MRFHTPLREYVLKAKAPACMCVRMFEREKVTIAELVLGRQPGEPV